MPEDGSRVGIFRVICWNMQRMVCGSEREEMDDEGK
jgi:hypothetical protein